MMKQQSIQLHGIQRGFVTLMGMMVALVVLGIITAGTVPLFKKEWDDKRTEITAAEIWHIATTAQKWQVDNGTWPDEANGCSEAVNTMLTATGYLDAMDSQSPWYDATTNPEGVYTTGCTATNFSVQVDTDTDYAGVIANTLAATTATDATTVTTVPTASEVPALNALLPRDGSRPMIGDLDMNGNNINSGNNVNAARVSVTDRLIGPLLVDSDNAAYYVNPSATSRVNAVDADSTYTRGNESANDYYIRTIGRWASQLNTDITNNTTNITNNTNIINGLRGWQDIYATGQGNNYGNLDISSSSDSTWVTCNGSDRAVKGVYLSMGGGSNTNWATLGVWCASYRTYVD